MDEKRQLHGVCTNMISSFTYGLTKDLSASRIIRSILHGLIPDRSNIVLGGHRIAEFEKAASCLRERAPRIASRQIPSFSESLADALEVLEIMMLKAA